MVFSDHGVILRATPLGSEDNPPPNTIPRHVVEQHARGMIRELRRHARLNVLRRRSLHLLKCRAPASRERVPARRDRAPRSRRTRTARTTRGPTRSTSDDPEPCERCGGVTRPLGLQPRVCVTCWANTVLALKAAA